MTFRVPTWRWWLPRRLRNAVESLTLVLNLVLVGLACSLLLIGAPRSATLGAGAGSKANTYVGSFSKQATVGNQDITIPVDLSAAPAGSWAIMFWTAGSQSASGAWEAHVASSCHGFVANGGGTISQYAISASAQDALNPSVTARRMAAAALTFVNFAGSGPRQEAEFVSFPSSTTMRLNWTNQADPDLCSINYMIFTGLTGAKVLLCQEPGVIGNKSYTGTGFSTAPDLVFIANGSSAAPPTTTSDTAWFAFGAFNATGEQWGTSIFGADAVSPTDTNRLQRTDSCLVMPTAGDAIQQRASFVSMDADGFTLNHQTIAGGAGGRYFAALCLDGISSKLGSFPCDTDAGAQVVASNHGFTAKGVLLASYAQATAVNPRTNANLGVGATDLVNARASAFQTLDAVNPSHSDCAWWTGKLLGLGDNGTAVATWRTMTLSGHSGSSFTINHDQARASADEVLYAIFG